MGREKEYRQRLKYQVGCVRRKTVESQIAVQLRNELAASLAEARLLSRRMARWLEARSRARLANQIELEASAGRDRFIRNGRGNPASVTLSPYEAEDLEVELEFGLKTMQAGRICRMIEQAYRQDALLSVRALTWLTNITPTSLRARLAGLRALGIYVPYLGLPRSARAAPAQLRSTWVLREYLAGGKASEIRRQAALGKAQFSELLHAFSQLAFTSSMDGTSSERERTEWQRLLEGTPVSTLKELLPAPAASRRGAEEGPIDYELRTEFGMPPVKVEAVRELLRELEGDLSCPRPAHTVVYWAVAAHEPAGKPLEACALVPVRLTLVDEGDLPEAGRDADFNRLREMKVNKALRYATEAKQGGGYLTYADLGYLLGLHPTAISGLLQQAGVVAPLRGSQCDIGRGVTHRREIIELFLQMYTETQICDRTGHSYEAVESYIKEFATVMLLQEQGMALPLIRKVTGRSLRLIAVYLELLRQYRRPEYAFRLNYLRRLAQASEDSWPKKGGLHR